MSRQRLTKAKRVRIFDRWSGCCHICGLRIQVGQAWDVEHIKPLWLGGADDETNMAPAHEHCHDDKTSAEATPRAKGTRIRANHLGIKTKPKGRPFSCNKNSPWKKKITGEVVRRIDRATSAAERRE